MNSPGGAWRQRSESEGTVKWTKRVGSILQMNHDYKPEKERKKMANDQFWANFQKKKKKNSLEMFEVPHLVSMNLQTGEGNTSHGNTLLKRQKLNATV